MKISPPVQLIVTELQRAGDGRFVDTNNVFRWTSEEHASAQDDIELHLMVKTVRKEMPGSNEVVEHALSATWQPFDVHGEWDDKWGNRRSPSGALTGAYAKSMFTAFATMVSRMPTVRFEIDALSFVGLITNFKPVYRRQAKIGWVFTISPHQNETVQVPQIKDNTSQPIAKWVQDATDTNSSINTSFDGIKNFSLKTPRVSRFNEVLSELNDAVSRLNTVSSQGFDTDTSRKLLLLATTFRRVRGACIKIQDSLKLLTSDEIAFTDVILQMAHAGWIAQTITDSWKLSGLSKQAELDVRKQARQKPKAIYYPKAGESLERISLKFYGTADHWRAIYDKNNLSSLILVGNEQLFIPEKNL